MYFMFVDLGSSVKSDYLKPKKKKTLSCFVE